MAPDGDAVFAWESYDAIDHRIEPVARAASGALGTVETLSVLGQPAQKADVGVNAAGDAIVAWTRSDGTDPPVTTVPRPRPDRSSGRR